jgi:hypothetical protein
VSHAELLFIFVNLGGSALLRVDCKSGRALHLVVVAVAVAVGVGHHGEWMLFRVAFTYVMYNVIYRHVKLVAGSSKRGILHVHITRFVTIIANIATSLLVVITDILTVIAILIVAIVFIY